MHHYDNLDILSEPEMNPKSNLSDRSRRFENDLRKWLSNLRSNQERFRKELLSGGSTTIGPNFEFSFK